MEPRVTDILEAGTWSGDPVDTVVLDYDDRFRRRIVLEGQGGLRCLLELADPRLLLHGEGLRLDDGSIIAVQAADEDLVEITCTSQAELIRVAWHLGNRHLPTQLMDGKLRIRNDHVFVDMVEKLGATVKSISAPFQPEGGAYGHGQVHSHDHPHKPDAAHHHH
ncbi:MAG: urease accessory protein UreE, partial [Pseudomonadota bacterium]